MPVLLRALALFVLLTACFTTLCCSGPEHSVEQLSTPVVSDGAININSASVDELRSLPGIGDTLAKRIVDFREKNGPFRKPEHLLLVPGISESKFRQLRSIIRVE